MSVGLRHLRYFAEAAEAGQLTRAAGALHMSQPAITQAVRELGSVLLERHPGGVRVTGAGGARPRGRRQARRLAETARLRIGFPPPTPEIVRRCLAPLRRRRPD